MRAPLAARLSSESREGYARYPLAVRGIGFMSSATWSLLRLHVVADADPGSLARVLQPFQNLNILPRKVVAELATTGSFHIEVDIGEVSIETMTLIVAKLRSATCIENAYWHPAF